MPQRRVAPPQGYMTAKRAKALLGNISDGMLRTYVMRGEINHLVPVTRTQGFYRTQDVRVLAEKLKPSMPDRTLRFMRGTVDDLPECETLLIQIFGPGVPANSIERRATWIEKNPETFFILRSGKNLVGCVFVLPLTKGKINQILSSQNTPPIYSDDIQIFSPDVSIDLYVMSACVFASDKSIETKRLYGSRLIGGLLKKIVELGSMGIRLDTIVSRSETADGIGLLRNMGFAEIETTTGFRNFVIDVRPSGIAGILRYKQALRQFLQS